MRAGLQVADGEDRVSAGRHHLRSEYLRGRHRHRGAQQLRRRVHPGLRTHQAEPALRAYFRWRVQHLLLLPRQRARSRGDAFGFPLPCHQGRHGHGHRECRTACDLRRHRPRASRARGGRDPQPPRRCDRASARSRRTLQGRRRQEARRRSVMAREAGE